MNNIIRLSRFEYFYFWDLFRNKGFLLAQLVDVNEVDDVDIFDDIDNVDDVGEVDDVDDVGDVDDVVVVCGRQFVYVGDVKCGELQTGQPLLLQLGEWQQADVFEILGEG